MKQILCMTTKDILYWLTNWILAAVMSLQFCHTFEFSLLQISRNSQRRQIYYLICKSKFLVWLSERDSSCCNHVPICSRPVRKVACSESGKVVKPHLLCYVHIEMWHECHSKGAFSFPVFFSRNMHMKLGTFDNMPLVMETNGKETKSPNRYHWLHISSAHNVNVCVFIVWYQQTSQFSTLVLELSFI